MTDVLILLDSFNAGGAEKQALLLVRHLVAESGLNVVVWSCSENGVIEGKLQQAGVQAEAVDFNLSVTRLQVPGLLFFLLSKLNRLNPKVIISFSINGNITFGLIWRFSKARMFIWGQRNDGRQLYSRRLCNWSAALTPVFVSNNLQGIEFLKSRFRIPKEKIVYIQNGIQIDQPIYSAKEWREKLKIAPEVFIAVMVANFTEAKDQPRLIKLWYQVLKNLEASGVKSKLILAGRFDKAVAIAKSMAWDLQLSEHQVEFIPEIEDITGFLTMANLAFFFSKSEGTPNSVIEYMMSGLPIISNDLPGVNIILSDENQKWIIKGNHDEDYINDIVSLIQDPEKLKFIGQANRKKCLEIFPAEKMYHSFDQLITKAVS